MARRSRLALCSALAVLLTGLGACSEAPLVSECIPSTDPTCETPTPEDEVVAGVNLTALFARPSGAEVDAARADLPPTPSVTSSLTPLTTGTDRRFILALDRGTERVLTALVRVPGSSDQSSGLPTVVILSDGTGGASESDLLTAPSWGPLLDGAVQVVVAYRGETLTLDDGTTFTSDLPSDPYRADVADLQALLSALPAVPRVFRNHMNLLGVGRGGTVGLLTAVQGVDLRSVVTLGAPTDLFGASFRTDVRTRLLGSPPSLPYPAFGALAAPVFQLRDGEISRAEARLGLLALSPAWLVAGRTLPPLFALHGSDDLFVGPDQLASLNSGLGPVLGSSVTLLVEGATHEDLIERPAVQSQIASFISNA